MPHPQPEPPPRPRSAARRFLNRLEVDRAVFFAICARLWQVFAGPITLFLFAQFSSPELQGVYTAFGFLLALSNLAELGMNTVTLYEASHHWHALSVAADGTIQGRPDSLSQLAQLWRFMNRWYGWLAVLFALVMTPVGLWYLGRRADVEADWRSPWVAASLLTSVSLAVSPRLTLLEGCHQIGVVNGLRLGQAIVGNAVVWTALSMGVGLWTAVASAAVKLLAEVWLVRVRYGRFFDTLRQTDATSPFPWRETVWPLQWRLAINSLLGYVTTQIFTIAAFEQHGLVVAGQTGMTWTVLTALQSVALAWVQSRAPVYGSLVARQDFRELDRVFFRVSKISLGIMVLGATIVVAGVGLLEAIHGDAGGIRASLPSLVVWFADKVSPRILPTVPTALYCIGLTVVNASLCLGYYIRAHRQDPLLPFNVISAVIISAAIWIGSKQFGPTGAAAAMCAGTLLTTLPFHLLVWRRVRAGHEAVVGRGGAW